METSRKVDRFAFGRNWQRFLDRYLTDERIARAKKETAEFLGVESLKGNSFLDIGCGSGLFSYVAHRLGASPVVSFDYDADSVAATERLREYVGSPEDWIVMRGSVLDQDFLNQLPRADVVYAWGVLHHTGDMWRALSNAAKLVPPGGLLFVSIYNKQEYATFTSVRGSHFWLKIKRMYNRGGWPAKLALEGWYRSKEIAKMLLTLKNPIRYTREHMSSRGMSWGIDITDWIGGLPYEFARVDEIFRYCHVDCGLELRNLRSTISLGCNEFLFQRPPEPA